MYTFSRQVPLCGRRLLPGVSLCVVGNDIRCGRGGEGQQGLIPPPPPPWTKALCQMNVIIKIRLYEGREAKSGQFLYGPEKNMHLPSGYHNTVPTRFEEHVHKKLSLTETFENHVKNASPRVILR